MTLLIIHVGEQYMYWNEMHQLPAEIMRVWQWKLCCQEN